MPEICVQRKEDLKDADKESLNLGYFSIAAKELREDGLVRNQYLQQFKEWIQQNRDIENCITDDNFLLRFLRTKKFSLPMAQQMLLKYLNFRRVFKSICYDLDYRNPNVNDLINRGFMFVSPYRDLHDRRIIMCIPNKIDPYKHTTVDVAKVAIITLETLLNDEKNQVLGVTYVGDGSGVTPAYVAMWNVTEFATLLKWGEHSYPIRHKAFNFTNVPRALKYVLDFAKSRLSPKLQQRLNVFEGESDLHKVIDSKSLPKEYGGEMDASKMIELWKEELEAKRDRLLSFDTMKLLSDKGIITRRRAANFNDITGLSGSFRKLEVD
nr:alpha-tocopherol transfer protein-like [Onthophagus taurus]